MPLRDAAARSPARTLAVAAVAIAGIALSLTPLAERIDYAVLDLEWRILERIDRSAAPDDILIVGVDDASVAAIPEPPGLWHAALGRVLTRIASAGPRAILLEFPLPERSYDGIKPGLDRALFDGLANAVEAAPLVAALNIDPRTRAARAIHKPYLALLGDSRLGLSLLARDPDGVARRYSLVVPTEDGGFPTVEGRMCRALKVDCAEGLVHYNLGKKFVYIPFRKVLDLTDDTFARQLFHKRIVLVGETLQFSGRIDVPVNPAAWESGRSDTPAIVLHAQTLRTALARSAPREPSRPLAVVLVSLAALLALMRDWRMAGVTAILVALLAAVAGVGLLRAGTFVALGAPLATLAVAFLVVLWMKPRPGSPP